MTASALRGWRRGEERLAAGCGTESMGSEAQHSPAGTGQSAGPVLLRLPPACSEQRSSLHGMKRDGSGGFSGGRSRASTEHFDSHKKDECLGQMRCNSYSLRPGDHTRLSLGRKVKDGGFTARIYDLILAYHADWYRPQSCYRKQLPGQQFLLSRLLCYWIPVASSGMSTQRNIFFFFKSNIDLVLRQHLIFLRRKIGQRR